MPLLDEFHHYLYKLYLNQAQRFHNVYFMVEVDNFPSLTIFIRLSSFPSLHYSLVELYLILKRPYLSLKNLNFSLKRIFHFYLFYHLHSTHYQRNLLCSLNHLYAWSLLYSWNHLKPFDFMNFHRLSENCLKLICLAHS